MISMTCMIPVFPSITMVSEVSELVQGRSSASFPPTLASNYSWFVSILVPFSTYIIYVYICIIAIYDIVYMHNIISSYCILSISEGSVLATTTLAGQSVWMELGPIGHPGPHF